MMTIPFAIVARRARAVSKIKTMILDSNLYSRGVMQDILRRAGASDIFIADNTEKLAYHAGASETDMLIIEHNSERTGRRCALDMVQQVRQKKTPLKYDIPIIMTVSSANTKLLGRARQSGIDSLLLRPISVFSIQERIERATRVDRKNFIDSPNYIGPCRRIKQIANYGGPWRRIEDQSEISVDNSKDMRLLKPVFASLQAMVSGPDKIEINALNALLIKHTDLVAMHGDPCIVRVFHSTRRYLQSVEPSDPVSIAVFVRHFRFAADYIEADPDTRQNLSAQIESLEETTRQAIIEKKACSGGQALAKAS